MTARNSLSERLGGHASLFGLAIAVGALAGLVAVAFQQALGLAGALRAAIAGGPASVWTLLGAIAFSALAVAAGVAAVRRIAPETAGSGIPRVEAALHGGGDMAWVRVLWVKFVGGLLSIGGGLTLGREGPTVQMGAALGRAVGGPLDRPDERGRTLVAAGAGAGLAAAFNSPLAGTVFVLEEMKVLRTPRHAVAALLAAVTADQVCRLFEGSGPQLGAVATASPPFAALPLFLALGVAAGLLGALFNRCLLGALGAARKLRAGAPRPAAAALLLAGAAVGMTGWLAPELLGPGDVLVERALNAPLDAAGAAVVFLARFPLTLVSYATGAAGGLFAPLLVLGAEMGVLAGHAGQLVLPASSAPLPALAVVGMGALFAASVRAPATGILLMVEMTGAFPLLLPLVYAAVLADLTARALGARPIYEALGEREAAPERAVALKGEAR